MNLADLACAKALSSAFSMLHFHVAWQMCVCGSCCGGDGVTRVPGSLAVVNRDFSSLFLCKICLNLIINCVLATTIKADDYGGTVKQDRGGDPREVLFYLLGLFI